LTHAPGAFFQVCAAWAAQAFQEVIEPWDLKGETLYDLYGGVGFFSALFGKRFQRRVLVEANPNATTHAHINLTALGLSTEIYTTDVATWLPEGLGAPGDLLVLDPPRSGLEPTVAQRLSHARAGRMVLIGCDGAAFCRDLQCLESQWCLERLAFLDLFPWTVHVEGVALLVRRSAL